MDSIRSKSTVRLPPSANIKIGLLICSVLVVIGTLFYSHRLVDELKNREQRIALLLGDALWYFKNTDEFDATLYLKVVEYTRNSNVPMIITDGDNVPSADTANFKNFNINIPFDSTIGEKSRLAFLQKEIKRMDKTYKPIQITYTDPNTHKESVTNYIHYGDSIILSKIEELPFIQLLLGAVVVVIGYLSFAYLKRSEQSNIWVGMSKETAHQLGTPLSSLLGWAEMLRLNSGDPKEVGIIATEIEKDIERLNRIAVRFSKIGAIPDLKEQNLVTVISGVMGYLEDRMPRLASNITLSLETSQDEIILPINRELFEWVMENLIKNATEAIETQTGSIQVAIHHNEKTRSATIDITDTGKGLEGRQKKDIFRPGYSTKSRGWGLGLPLAKRIIEEYHHGKLFVKESTPGKGTTFRIKLGNG
ncbi:MAG: HAMP domain-containing sensor histidine kinase [Bacteroidota bacterium]|nr:HAMP domain-containing sensor histidine kinase [Bacteroidota bacterium]MDP4230193.1 HAMP domain-containing sensor histidine kinase [Bacteroidota bacterium]MDP4237162.1 HAMP domain-containing sensor histidine kinase [Bacteroidota bacterium]